MLANYTKEKNLSYTDQALLFGITSRIGFTDENVVEAPNNKQSKFEINAVTQKGVSGT